jgi:hypothetical protein
VAKNRLMCDVLHDRIVPNCFMVCIPSGGRSKCEMPVPGVTQHSKFVLPYVEHVKISICTSYENIAICERMWIEQVPQPRVSGDCKLEASDTFAFPAHQEE